MKMKNILGCLLVGSAMFVSTSCEDFTEVQPKGTNLLSTTTQLEMLLNYEYRMGKTDWSQMCGDMMYGLVHIPTEISKPNKTRNVIIWTFDEANQDKMAELTSSDIDYSDFYGIIGKVCNPIMLLVDDAEGDEATKARLKSEALVLRSYFHWLAVNKFAKAYNPSTASEDSGIIYMTEAQDIIQPAEQLTVQQVYDNILADLDQAIELNALPDVAVNRMRISKPCAYAAKALVLASMQKFDEASSFAEQALAINGKVSNYNSPEMQKTMTGYITGGTYPIIYRERLKCEEDLFFTYEMEYYNAYGPETLAAFEEGHACKDKLSCDRMVYDYTMGMGASYGLPDYTYSYDRNSGWNMMGMKTTHMYLIVAEAEIHKGNFDAAMEALDAIRVNRIDPSVYAPLKGTVTTKEDAMFRLKQTSHGENIYSVYNFINKKRWNQVAGWEQDVTRTIDGKTYTLRPNSPLWIFPFPQNVMNNNPNITQNYKKN